MINEMLPGFRALVAKKLIEEHGMSQTQVAERLETTQPAISQYRRDLRGKKTKIFMKNPRLIELIESVASNIAMSSGSADNGLEFCKVCKFMRENEMVSGPSMC